MNVKTKTLWHKNFTLLFSSKVLKYIGDNFASIAFVWMLIERGGGAVSTAILLFCTIVPQMVLTTFVSPFLSRGKLQQWMFASDFLRALVVLVVPVCYLLDSLPIWLFFVSAVIQSVLGTVYGPASVALLPRIVHASKVQQANALLQSSLQVVALIGLAGAAALVTLIGASTTLLVTSVLFIISAGLIVMVRTSSETESNSASQQNKTAAVPYLRQLREGFIIVRENKLIFWLSVYAVFINIGATPYMALSPVYVSEHLHQDAATLTLMRGTTAIGALVMGIVLAKVNIVRQGGLFTLAGIAGGVAFLFLGQTTNIMLIAALCFVQGISMTAINVPEMVIVQTTVPAQQQAQVFSVLMTFSFALTPAAILITGPLAQAFGPAAIITIGGALTMIAGILIHFCTPLSKLQIAPKTVQVHTEAI